MEGEGLLDIWNTTKNTVKELFSGLRKDAPPYVRDMLAKHGDVQIKKINVCRAPIQKMITALGKLISFGDIAKEQKKLHYDELYHLYLMIELTNGIVLRFEKNQVAKMRIATRGDFLPAGGACLVVNIPKGLTLNSMIGRALKMVGKTRLWVYSVEKYNCQTFVFDILNHSRLMTQELTSFIVQDAPGLLKSSPITRKFAKLGTDIASKIDQIVYGNGITGL